MQAFLAGDTARRDEAKLSQPDKELRISTIIIIVLTCRVDLWNLPGNLACWSWRRDLNPRPSDYKSDALPAELRQPTQQFALCKPHRMTRSSARAECAAELTLA